MFDIGWSELVVIAVVALIAIGPKELPGVLRMVGQWMGKARKMAAESGPVPGGDARGRDGRPQEEL
jgi:Tat protein translocase TatB subunit